MVIVNYDTIDIKRKLELEDWLLNKYPDGCNGYRNLENFLEESSICESDYLLDACLVPRRYIEQIIREYNINDISDIYSNNGLVESVAREFKVSNYIIVNRIMDILNILKLEKNKKLAKRIKIVV